MKFALHKVLLFKVILISVLISGCSAIETLPPDTPEYNLVTSFAPVEDKAVLYVFRSKSSDFKLYLTTIDIGDVDLEISPSSVHRFEIPPGQYNMEPDGVGTFSFEEELDVDLKAGEVYFVELKHSARLGVPNKSELLESTESELRSVMEVDKLFIAPIVRI
mgnify:CR=1 FL=1